MIYDNQATGKPESVQGVGGQANAGTAMKRMKITAAGDTVVKASPGVYYGYWCSAITSGGNFNVYDHASDNAGDTVAPQVATIAAGNPTFPFGDKGSYCENGITINLSGTPTGIVLYVYYR